MGTFASLYKRHALPAPTLEISVNYQTCAVGLFVCQNRILSVACQLVRPPVVLRAAVPHYVNKYKDWIYVPSARCKGPELQLILLN